MILWLLAACHLAAPSGPNEGEAGDAMAADAPAAPPTFDRHCSADADCAVVAACAGLDHIPADPPAESCGSACFTAIRAADVALWTQACAAVEAKVPCDLKRGKCASLDTVSAKCQFGTCQVF